ncbi:MAG: hypothetical protein RR664_05350 [Clostridia bacterium]
MFNLYETVRIKENGRIAVIVDRPGIKTKKEAFYLETIDDPNDVIVDAYYIDEIEKYDEKTDKAKQSAKCNYFKKNKLN